MSNWLRTLLALVDSWRYRNRDAPKGYTLREAEFLSAVMEVEEAPPAPLARVLLWLLVFMLTVAMIWAWLAKLDIVVEARGKIYPQDEVKTIQAVIAGEIARLNVREGEHVSAGDILIEMEKEAADAERNRLAEFLVSTRLEEARARSLTEVVSEGKITSVPVLATMDSLSSLDPERIEEMQRRVEVRHGELQALVRQRNAQHDALQALRDAAQRQRDHAIRGLESQKQREAIEMTAMSLELNRQKENLGLVRTAYEREQKLLDQGIISKAKFEETQFTYLDARSKLESMQDDKKLRQADARIERERLEASLDSALDRIRELDAELQKNNRELEVMLASFAREMTDEWLKAKENLREIELELVKQEEIIANHVITAPVDGVVEQLEVHFEGAVVQPSQPLLVVVPAGALLQAEVLVENKDVGFLEIGQAVAMKLDAFPHFKFGLIEGELLDIADDALEIEGVGLMYPAKISLLQHEVNVDGRMVPLSSGMSVTAEVRTGERGLYEFFLEPLLHLREEALDER